MVGDVELDMQSQHLVEDVGSLAYADINDLFEGIELLVAAIHGLPFIQARQWILLRAFTSSSFLGGLPRQTASAER